MVLGCILAWSVLVVTSVVRAVSTDWYPVFDQALIAVGARDVLTEHHRWIGTVASVSLEGVLASHPGPLQFDLVAVPVRLFGSGAGLAVGVAAVNFGAGLVSIIAAARQGGRGAAVANTVGLCLLVWSAGNQVLIDPYNPTASMVPFFAVLVLAWATVNGDRWALPWLVGWASLCVQANIAYAVTALPIVAGAIGVYLWRRRGRGAGRDVLVRCGLVGLLLWLQPLLEQITQRTRREHGARSSGTRATSKHRSGPPMAPVVLRRYSACGQGGVEETSTAGTRNCSSNFRRWGGRFLRCAPFSLYSAAAHTSA